MKLSNSNFLNLAIVTLTALLIASCESDTPVSLPPIEHFSFTIEEGLPVGTIIGNISVDSNNTSLSYSLISGKLMEGFSVNANTGILSVANSDVLDYETISTDTLKVMVSNGSSSHSESTVAITLIDIDDTRYLHQIFDSITISKKIAYASLEGTQTMNIYEPFGDTDPSRTVVILVPGGGFDRNLIVISQELYRPLAEKLAKTGYVAAILDYRTEGPYSTPDDYAKCFTYALYDLKGSIRYFNKDSKMGRQYKGDPTNIFIMGYSAGAQISLFHAYRNTVDEYQAIELEILNKFNGPEGNSGSEGYSSQIQGIISIAGNLTNLSSIKFGDPALLCIHGTDDTAIPIDSSDSEFGIAYGSRPLIQRAKEVGVPNKFIEMQRQGHHFLTEDTFPELFDDIISFVWKNRYVDLNK